MREAEAERALDKLRLAADEAIAAYNRAANKGEVERYYSPLEPRDGTLPHVPAGISRKYARLKLAMQQDDPIAVHELQVQLKRSGFEMPTTASECDAALERLLAQREAKARDYYG